LGWDGSGLQDGALGAARRGAWSVREDEQETETEREQNDQKPQEHGGTRMDRFSQPNNPTTQQPKLLLVNLVNQPFLQNPD
jgi:hypothetical protein